MTLDEAIRKRINELLKERNMSLTSLCLNSNLTPSTIFEFMYKKTQCPKAVTIKKLCYGAGITLSEFYKPDYFNDFNDVMN